MEKQTILNTEQLRAAMRAWTTGVGVLTTIHNGEMHGMTINSFTSISLEPALVSLALQHNTRTFEMVSHSNIFGINILADDQRSISERFSSRGTNHSFEDLPIETLITGAPFIKGALAWMDCRAVHTYDAGESTLFIAEVLAARGDGTGTPLLYHNRNYWKLTNV